MKYFTSLIFLAGAVLAHALEAPRSVAIEAQQATQELADEVRRGNFEVTISKMYPRWKGRMAARVGSAAKLEKQLREAAERMKKGGIIIQSFTAGEPQSVRGVWNEKQIIDGREQLAPTEWMALVPTETTFRVAAEGGEVHRVKASGFQVVIRPIAGGEWTFIDGGSLKMSDLRAVFPSIPADLELPKRGGEKL